MKFLPVLLFGIIIVVGCKKNKTSWDTTWSAPLISDTLDLANLTNDSTLVIENGAYKIELNRKLFDFNLTELIEIPDTTVTETFTTPISIAAAPGFNIVNSIEEHKMNFKDVQLKSVIMSQGFIDVTIFNPLPTKTFFNVKLPGVSKNGIEFNKSYSVPAHSNGVDGTTTETISLSGYSLDLTGLSGGDFNFIKSQITATTDPDGVSVNVTPQDQIDVTATFRDVKINYARGYFGNQQFVDTTALAIDVLSKVAGGTIDIPNTVIKLTFENGLKVAGKANLLFAENTNWDGQTVQLDHPQIGIPFNLDPAIGTWDNFTSGKKELEFTSSNSTIEQYIENLGVTHAFSYDIEINPWGNTSGSFDEMFSDSRLSVVLNASMPLNVALDDLTVLDSFDLNLGDVTDNFSLRSGQFKLETENAFPFDGEVTLYFIDELGQMIDSIQGSEKVQSGQFGSMNNQGFMTANSTVLFTISETIGNKLEFVDKVVVRARLNTIDMNSGVPEQLPIPENAFLKFILKAKFTSTNSF